MKPGIDRGLYRVWGFGFRVLGYTNLRGLVLELEAQPFAVSASHEPSSMQETY